jgi:hypothetical protein
VTAKPRGGRKFDPAEKVPEPEPDEPGEPDVPDTWQAGYGGRRRVAVHWPDRAHRRGWLS